MLGVGVGRGGGAFSMDFTINLSPQCRAFSRALKTEKLKAPLFPGPVRAVTTNDGALLLPLGLDELTTIDPFIEGFKQYCLSSVL